MADTTPAPALPSTADEAPYVPVSWMAAAAAGVAGLFALVLVVLAASAFIGKKPLLIDELLVLPVVGIVLSFAARRMIRNSEGTRTGEGLVSAAWWVCLVGGLGYAAYLLGVSFSVRRDAAAEAERWAGYLVSPDENNNLNRAFLRTLDPGRRGSFTPDDTANLVAQFRNPYLEFGQSDLARLARRNPGGCRFVRGAIKDWSYKPGVIDCTYAGTVVCPEGTFPFEVPLKGVDAGVQAEGGAGRQWVVIPPPNGYLVRDKVALTPYGWRVFELEREGGALGRAFVARSGAGALAHPFVYHEMVAPEAEREYAAAVARSAPARVAAAGAAGILVPYYTPRYADYLRTDFFRLPGGGSPPADKRDQFLRYFSDYGLLTPGGRLTGNDKVDAHDLLAVTDRVAVRVPCEVPFPGAGGNLSAARARVVVVCDDPAVVAELKALREAANPDRGATDPPADFGKRPGRWRVVGVESDMHEVRVDRQAMGGPGGMGG